MHEGDLLEALYGFHSQFNFHDEQEKLVEGEINQEMKVDPQDLSLETNENLSTPLYKTKEDIQHHGQSAWEEENNCCLIQRKQRLPPLLTEEEINQTLRMQPTSQYLCDQEINSIFSTTSLCTEVVHHKETTVEKIDAEVVLHSEEGLLLEITFSHQNDFLQTRIKQSQSRYTRFSWGHHIGIEWRCHIR